MNATARNKGGEPPDWNNVTPITRARTLVDREPQASDAELAEYRKMKQALMQMLEEWLLYRNVDPIAKRLFDE